MSASVSSGISCLFLTTRHRLILLSSGPRSPRDEPRGRARVRSAPPTEPGCHRERAVFDRAQEGGEESSPVVGVVDQVQEGLRKRRVASFKTFTFVVRMVVRRSYLAVFVELLAERETARIAISVVAVDPLKFT